MRRKKERWKLLVASHELSSDLVQEKWLTSGGDERPRAGQRMVGSV